MKFNLSEITELIKSRRSIRPESFTSRKVQRDQIELILGNAQWAPNHGKTEPWRFIVFEEEEARKSLSQELGSIYLNEVHEKDQNDAKLAKLIRRPLISSVVIAVCMSRQKEERIQKLKKLKRLLVPFKICSLQRLPTESAHFGLRRRLFIQTA